jgi:hypothetical protein
LDWAWCWLGERFNSAEALSTTLKRDGMVLKGVEILKTLSVVVGRDLTRDIVTLVLETKRVAWLKVTRANAGLRLGHIRF